VRTRVIMVVVIVAAVVSIVLANVGGNDGDEAPAEFPRRTVQAGGVEVALQPLRIDASGAVLEVVLDTHVTELDMDLTAGAVLDVGGQPWPTLAWEGDGPGGHHREGRLRFDAAGPAAGTVTLRLRGFEAPVEATWTMGETSGR
jgi:hypothetical protein